MAEAKLENFDNVRKILPICVTLHQLYDNFAPKDFEAWKKILTDEKVSYYIICFQ